MSPPVRKSPFAAATLIPSDAIFDVTRRYLQDQDPHKVNLGQGTYRDGNGQPWVLPSVRLAKDKITNSGHEYLPIAGLKDFRNAADKLAFGGTRALREDRVGRDPIS